MTTTEKPSPSADSLARCLGMELEDAARVGVSEDDQHMALAIALCTAIKRQRTVAARLSLAGFFADCLTRAVELANKGV